MQSLGIMNAAGWVKRSGEGFDDLLRSAVTEITIGSLTMDKRPGNSGECFVTLPDGTSVNSMGLPNQGIVGFGKNLSELANATRNSGKFLRLSIAPVSLDDVKSLSLLTRSRGVNTLELNLGCPNVHSEGKRKPIFAYDLKLTHDAVFAARERWTGGKLAIKLSPYEDMDLSRKMARLMNNLLSNGDSVVLCNTKPDFCPKDEDGVSLLRAMSPHGDTINSGGMGGTSLKQISLQNIKIFRSVLREEIGITGVGGISTGKDMLDYIRAGASAVQVGTAFFNSNAHIFSDVLQEYVDSAEYVDEYV